MIFYRLHTLIKIIGLRQIHQVVFMIYRSIFNIFTIKIHYNKIIIPKNKNNKIYSLNKTIWKNVN